MRNSKIYDIIIIEIKKSNRLKRSKERFIMNILKLNYAHVWEVNNEFKLVNVNDEAIFHVDGAENMCIMLAVHLNTDCKLTGQLIDDFIENYLIVDCNKEVFTVDYRYKGDDVIIYLESRGETIVTFNMSEYIEADERYY